MVVKKRALYLVFLYSFVNYVNAADFAIGTSRSPAKTNYLLILFIILIVLLTFFIIYKISKIGKKSAKKR